MRMLLAVGHRVPIACRIRGRSRVRQDAPRFLHQANAIADFSHLGCMLILMIALADARRRGRDLCAREAGRWLMAVARLKDRVLQLRRYD